MRDHAAARARRARPHDRSPRTRRSPAGGDGTRIAAKSPELYAGWPQQVSPASGTTTRQPASSSSCTAAKPTDGRNMSTRQVTNRPTRRGELDLSGGNPDTTATLAAAKLGCNGPFLEEFQPELADRRRRRARSCSRTSTCSRSSRASTASGSPSAWCTRSARAPTATSRSPTPRRPATRACGMLCEVGKQTPVFARFSTVAGSRGARRQRARPARLRAEVLHRGRQLGPRGQQHAGLLHPRSAQVPRLHPQPEARPLHERAGARERLGLLLLESRGDPPVHLAVRRPRHPGVATATWTASARTRSSG